MSWLGGGTVASIGFATAYALGMVLAAVVGPLTDRRTGIANLRVAPASLAILVVVSSVVLSRLLGRGISLSTLDLQRAIQIADEGGPVWAASIAALSAAVPLLGLFGGLAPLLARLTYEQTAHFAAGLATMGLAQLGLAAWLLSGWSSSPAVDSLAFGFLLSAMGELVIGFLILGSVILCQEGLAKFIF